MNLKQIDLLLYVWLLINAIGWFGYLTFPRLRKSLLCKERADGIVEDIVETKNAKGQPLFRLLSAIRRDLLLTHAKRRIKRTQFGKKESLRSFIIRTLSRKMHLSKTLHGQER